MRQLILFHNCQGLRPSRQNAGLRQSNALPDPEGKPDQVHWDEINRRSRRLHHQPKGFSTPANPFHQPNLEKADRQRQEYRPKQEPGELDQGDQSKQKISQQDQGIMKHHCSFPTDPRGDRLALKTPIHPKALQAQQEWIAQVSRDKWDHGQG